MLDENINIHARDQKFRIGIFSPADWGLGMSKPSMVIELYPVFHRSSVSFESSIVEMPEVIDGLDPEYVAEKVASAIRAELETEGTLPKDDRIGDNSWILSQTNGTIWPGTEYKVVVWVSYGNTGNISDVWVASTDAVGRKTVSGNEPRGHCYRV